MMPPMLTAPMASALFGSRPTMIVSTMPMNIHPSSATTKGRANRTMGMTEIVNMAIDSFAAAKVRFALTALGMVIGTASLILVVTIGLTGKQYIMSQIQAIGANLIFAEYEGGAQRITNITPDPLT